VLTALRADGTEAGTYTLPARITSRRPRHGLDLRGRQLPLAAHATFTRRGGKLFVKDEGSLNGVYRRSRATSPRSPPERRLPHRPGDPSLRDAPAAPPSPDGVERLGSPVKGYVGRIALIIGRETTGNAFPVPETGIHLGRERGDVLFPEDGYVSGSTAASRSNGKLFLTDLGSSNGSFVRLGGESRGARQTATSS
jgi:hypothetical protein